MSTASTRRDILAQRIASMRDGIDRFLEVDSETLLSGLDSTVKERLAHPRLIPRLAMRRARRLAGRDLFSPALDDRDSLLLEGGASAVEELTLATGVHILWRDIIRIVRRAELEALDAATNLPVREIALRGRGREIGIAQCFDPDEYPDLVERIRREGALSWACWLAVRDPASARRLRVFTPVSITRLLPKAMPTDPLNRDQRRLVVDVEINAMMKLGMDANLVQEVA